MEAKHRFLRFDTRCKQAVELVFAKDFSLTCKNNVETGTASVTLHSKNEITCTSKDGEAQYFKIEVYAV
ncbi:MAG: hypothetical protein LBK58_05255 [Prevotellaceae bacterium]|jgi:hypothetical protein|nr:hypothetical protein [Prevotellaceae bacterium]